VPNRPIQLSLLVTALVLGFGAFLSRFAGTFLKVNSAKASDLVIVLSGADNYNRVARGINMLEHGYAHQLLIDERADIQVYGYNRAELAEEFVRDASPETAGRMQVCRIEGDSLFGEARNVRACLCRVRVQTILLLVRDFQSRRAQLIFTRVLSEYKLTVAPVGNPEELETTWWENREWAKNTATEWLRLIWWLSIDSWRKPEAIASSR